MVLFLFEHLRTELLEEAWIFVITIVALQSYKLQLMVAEGVVNQVPYDQPNCIQVYILFESTEHLL